MAETTNITLGPFATGTTVRLRVPPIRKDGVPWDLSGPTAAVTLTFHRPDQTTFERTAQAEDAANGIFYYDTTVAGVGAGTVTDLDLDGAWALGVTVEDGSILAKYAYDIGFQVVVKP